jgi:hypothetical protein
MFSFNINRKIDSALKKNDRERIFHRFDSMKRVLIFFALEDWNKIRNITQDLESRGKKVLLWTIQYKQKEESQIIFPGNVRVISHKEISVLWGLSSSIVKEFKNTACDTIIDLTDGSDKWLLYLLASNRANFCIGINEPKYKVYDFVVLRGEESGLPETYQQIKFYLNNIR